MTGPGTELRCRPPAWAPPPWRLRAAGHPARGRPAAPVNRRPPPQVDADPLLAGPAVLGRGVRLPVLWLLSASFKTRANVFDNKLIPDPFTTANYAEVWHVAPLLRWLGNSGYIGLLAATLVTASSALVAFGFAYFRFPGRNLVFGTVLGR